MKNKKAAMEMSIGTIVTIVLVVTTMVLGLVLIRSIFFTGTDAINNIDTALQNEIKQLFTEEGSLVIYPVSRKISLKPGDDPKGFAFSVRNNDAIEDGQYTYEVIAIDASRCGRFNEDDANDMLLGGSGEFELNPGAKLEFARMVLLEVPDTAPPCTIIYNLEIDSNIKDDDVDIFVTIK